MDFSEYRVLEHLSQKVYESCDHKTVKQKSCPLQIFQDGILYLELSYAVKDDDTQIVALLWEQSNCNKDLLVITLSLQAYAIESNEAFRAARLY